MGATFMYYVKPKESSFESSYNSQTIDRIKKIFGKSVSDDDLDKLDSLFIATGDKIYEELKELVLKHQEIYLKEEW